MSFLKAKDKLWILWIILPIKVYVQRCITFSPPVGTCFIFECRYLRDWNLWYNFTGNNFPWVGVISSHTWPYFEFFYFRSSKIFSLWSPVANGGSPPHLPLRPSKVWIIILISLVDHQKLENRIWTSSHECTVAAESLGLTERGKKRTFQE